MYDSEAVPTGSDHPMSWSWLVSYLCMQRCMRKECHLDSKLRLCYTIDRLRSKLQCTIIYIYIIILWWDVMKLNAFRVALKVSAWVDVCTDLFHGFAIHREKWLTPPEGHNIMNINRKSWTDKLLVLCIITDEIIDNYVDNPTGFMIRGFLLDVS